MTEEEAFALLGWDKEQSNKAKALGGAIAERMIYGDLPYAGMVKEVSEMEEFPVSMRCHLTVTIHKTVDDVTSSPELVALITLRNLLKDIKQVNKDGEAKSSDN